MNPTPLTKKTFWDPLEQLYPDGLSFYLSWIDNHKITERWDDLFGPGPRWLSNEPEDPMVMKNGPPKYHQLPAYIQFGIFLEFVNGFNDATFHTSSFADLFALDIRTTISYAIGLIDAKIKTLNKEII